MMSTNVRLGVSKSIVNSRPINEGTEPIKARMLFWVISVHINSSQDPPPPLLAFIEACTTRDDYVVPKASKGLY